MTLIRLYDIVSGTVHLLMAAGGRRTWQGGGNVEELDSLRVGHCESLVCVNISRVFFRSLDPKFWL